MKPFGGEHRANERRSEETAGEEGEARCAGGEPHAVAAVLGGVGAQEVIKLVTDQFEPEAHTLVYDAAKAVTAPDAAACSVLHTCAA